jgi:hypothetical protein
VRAGFLVEFRVELVFLAVADPAFRRRCFLEVIGEYRLWNSFSALTGPVVASRIDGERCACDHLK